MLGSRCCAAALVLLVLTASASADQALFVHVGRVSQVSTQVRQFGDIRTNLALNVRIPAGAGVDSVEVDFIGGEQYIDADLGDYAARSGVAVHQVQSSCDVGGVSSDSTCIGMRAVNGCTWASLPTLSKAALTTLLGSTCTKTCFTATGTMPGGGETFQTFSWSCQDAATASCVLAAGTEGRIDLIEGVGGCQF